MPEIRRVRVIDSHTEGEPTRVVLEGAPELKADTLPGKVDELRREHDGLRSGLICEPRGHEAIVGAYLFEPRDDTTDIDVVFFNNAQYLGMCGHGTIGVVETLRFLGRIGPGKVRMGTPVGPVEATLHPDGRVSVRNVESYRLIEKVSVQVPGYGEVVGDVAYGGNWFFLADAGEMELSLASLGSLTAYTTAIMHALAAQGITGGRGLEIDHVEIFGPPTRPDANSKNFVLCPGLAYDRSPCGTGLSAKLACLAADGKLKPGEVWRQESIIGSLFEGRYENGTRGVRPEITGRAWVTGDSSLVFQQDDPFLEGIVA